MAARVIAMKAIANPTRTAVQLVPAGVITEFIDAWVYNMSDKQYAAMLGLLLLVFSYGQSLYENLKGRAIIKPASPASARKLGTHDDHAAAA